MNNNSPNSSNLNNDNITGNNNNNNSNNNTNKQLPLKAYFLNKYEQLKVICLVFIYLLNSIQRLLFFSLCYNLKKKNKYYVVY